MDEPARLQTRRRVISLHDAYTRFRQERETWVPQQLGVGGVQEGIWEVSLGSSAPQSVGTEWGFEALDCDLR